MAAVMAAPEAVAAPSSLLLLVVGGECGCPGLLAHILEELERGGAAGTGAAAAGRGVRVGLGVPAGRGPGGAQRPRTQRSGRPGPRVPGSPWALRAGAGRWVWVGARRPGPRVGQGRWGVGFREYRVPGAAWGPGGRRIPGSGVPAGCGLPLLTPPVAGLARFPAVPRDLLSPLLIGAWVARPPRGSLARGELTQVHLSHWDTGGAASPATGQRVRCTCRSPMHSGAEAGGALKFQPAWATRPLSRK